MCIISAFRKVVWNRMYNITLKYYKTTVSLFKELQIQWTKNISHVFWINNAHGSRYEYEIRGRATGPRYKKRITIKRNKLSNRVNVKLNESNIKYVRKLFKSYEIRL